MTLLLKSWHGLMSMTEPIRSRHLRRRVLKGKEQSERLCERYGKATISRSEGPLLWVHAASNGEALAALPLIDALRAETPNLLVLVTTFTVTGAELIGKQAPHVTHQYKPSEDPVAIQAFLRHWHPDLALFVESEFWPNLITQTSDRGIPMAQVNGHLSQGSFRGWRLARGSFRELMSRVSACLVKTDEIKSRMVALGVSENKISVTGDLKSSRAIEYPQSSVLSALREQIGSRPVFLAASTHPGEEEAVADAHEAQSARAPDYLTIIAPRHAVRGDEIEAMLKARGMTVHRRSRGETPNGAAIYLADTTGEMPLWYSVSPITFIGAGWGESGGHNPLEAAQLGSVILSGPNVHASQAAFDNLQRAGAVQFVSGAEDLTAALRALTDEQGQPTDEARAMANAAQAASAPDPGPLARTLEGLRPLTERAFR